MVDFPASTENGSFCVKPCVDDKLDDLKRRQNGLPDLLNVVTEEEIARLPREVGTCTVCYIPHVGYLVAMPFKQAVAEQGFDYKNIPGYQFMFENNGAMHYRNECTESLDEKLGDVVLDITRIETRIQAQLTEQVLDARICLTRPSGGVCPNVHFHMDKLAKITKLNEKVAGGKQLEKNQLEMISKKKELTEELKQCGKKRKFRNLHTADNFFSILTLFVHH